MEQTKIADQTAEFMDLMVKASDLSLRGQGNGIAKVMGKDFSVV